MALKDRSQKIDWGILESVDASEEDIFGEIFSSRWIFRLGVLLAGIGVIEALNGNRSELLQCIAGNCTEFSFTGGPGVLLFFGFVIVIIHVMALVNYVQPDSILGHMIWWMRENLDDESKVTLCRHIASEMLVDTVSDKVEKQGIEREEIREILESQLKVSTEEQAQWMLRMFMQSEYIDEEE